VVKARNGEMGTEPLSEGHSGRLAVRHRKGLSGDVPGCNLQQQYSLRGWMRELASGQPCMRKLYLQTWDIVRKHPIRIYCVHEIGQEPHDFIATFCRNSRS
jgi:hypothetical protein